MSGGSQKMRWKKPKANSKRSPPPSSLHHCRWLPEYKPPRDPVDSNAYHVYTFRLEHITRWIPNWSNTSTRNRSRKDRTDVRAAIARAVAVVVEKKFAGRRQIIVCNDYHVGNASVGDRGTPKESAVDICAKIRFCGATILVVPLQENRPRLRAAEDFTQSGVSLDRNTLKQEQCWQKVCPHCVGKCRRTTCKNYDGRSERKEFVEGTNVSSLLDTSNTSEHEVSRILVGYCRSLKTCIYWVWTFTPREFDASYNAVSWRELLQAASSMPTVPYYHSNDEW